MTRAETQYHKTKAEILTLIEFAKMELGTDPDRIQWGHVGDVTSIKDQVLGMLTGMTCRGDDTEADTRSEIITAMQDAMEAA